MGEHGRRNILTINGGNGDGIFAIANSGALTIADNTNLDYDTTQSYTLTLVASDLNSQFEAWDPVTINIQDVNDESAVFTSSASPTINENVQNVVSITSTDADSGDTVTYSITGGADQALFEISSNTRSRAALRAIDLRTRDVGSDNEYIVQVTASDGAIHPTQPSDR